MQMLDPWCRGGANKPSLAQAQKNYIDFGACDEHGKRFVKGIQPTDEKDPQWRIALETDRDFIKEPKDIGEAEWSNLSVWYYWLQKKA